MNTIELFFTNTKRVFSLLVGLISFTIGTIADEGADIVIRALPLATPMPNAISVFWVSQTTLGFSWWQALAFAATIEFALFGLFEVTLIMFDGYQDMPARYRWPFIISVAVSLLVLVLIVIIVYRIESAHTVLASLPLLSAAGATALALKRWHVRNRKVPAIVRSAKSQRTSRILPSVIAKNSAHVIEQITPQLPDTELDPIAKMNAGRQRKIEKRRAAILSYLSRNEPSIPDLVTAINVSENTIRKDLAALQSAGHTMSINGIVSLAP